MHEAFYVDPHDGSVPGRSSRPWFDWPNALFAELVMAVLPERLHGVRIPRNGVPSVHEPEEDVDDDVHETKDVDEQQLLEKLKREGREGKGDG